ncbi:hypothetical protein [Saccharothrix deserti]|uniref:hypothetical protein n=1 Tax=Saccharothrix deserti TaxID=2593674 RepID=UPI00131B7497|nr:hypothetical protein [Saccharothrix deserti]
MLKNWFRKVGPATLACAAVTTLVAAPSAQAAGNLINFTNHRNHAVWVAVVVKSNPDRWCIRVVSGASLAPKRQFPTDTVEWAARVSCSKSDPVIARKVTCWGSQDLFFDIR